MTYRRVAASAR